MRTFSSVIAGLVAMLALAVALPMLWVDGTIGDRDEYVKLSGALLNDSEIRSILSTSTADALDEAARNWATDHNLPQGAVPDVRDQVVQVADGVLSSQAAQEAWAESQRLSWDAMFTGENTGFVLNVSPILSLIASEAQIDIGETDVSVVLNDSFARGAIKAVDRAETLGWAAATIAAAGAFIALVVARRRLVILALLGLGAVIAAAIDKFGATLADRALDTRGSGISGIVLDALGDLAVESFDRLLLWTAIAGAVVAVLGGIAAMVIRPKQHSQQTWG